MLAVQKEYLEDLKNLETVLGNAGIDIIKVQTLEKAIGEQEILVPVVGEFSAGKSSLLNSFIGGEIPVLPTALTPETALATELRYDVNERIEALDSDSNIVQTYEIGDFASINKNASSYSYLRLYLNNDNIRSIQPLTLVDMPGFESPLDAHNDAIRKYLNKGAYFIVLVSATDGTLKNASFRHLNDIMEYERDFSVVISKSNLVTKENLKKIAEKVSSDIDMNLAVSKNPVCVERDGQTAIKAIVSDLDPNKLFRNIISPVLKDYLYQLESTLNVKISALNRDSKQNDEVVNSLKKAVQKLLSEEESLKNDAQTCLIDNNVQIIVNAVGKDLSNNVDNLVDIGVKGGGDALTSEISDIVHSSLVTNIKSGIKNISEQINTKFAVELKSLNEVMADYDNGNFVEKLSTSANNLFDKVVGGLTETVENRKKSEKTDAIYTAITSVLAITTDIIAPIFEVLIVFLPEILNFLTSKIKEKKAREELRQQLLVTIIPNIKRKLSEQIPGILQEQVEKMIEEISERYKSIIESKESEIEKAEEERKSKAEEISETIIKLEDAKKSVNNMSSKLYA